MKLLSPAKINLSLRILNKREDGYHNIKSILQTVSLYDEIFISDSSSGKEIDFVCKPEVTKKPEDNLAYKAILLLKRYTSEKRKVKVKIIKNIPVGAGLGGGSSNAATILKGLAKFWNIKISLNELKKLALKLGADVTFFLYGGKCLVEGSGERIKKLKLKEKY
ncbi:MAG: 4-(cytidine 5'-diphospho)-2-C-methyl-D-erythritol kinase [Endomicrobiia bacterium]